MLGARFHRSLYLSAKSAAEMMAVTGEVAPVKPSDTGSINLRG